LLARALQQACAQFQPEKAEKAKKNRPAGPGGRLVQKWLNQFWSMIFSENRRPLFGIML